MSKLLRNLILFQYIWKIGKKQPLIPPSCYNCGGQVPVGLVLVCPVSSYIVTRDMFCFASVLSLVPAWSLSPTYAAVDFYDLS